MSETPKNDHWQLIFSLIAVLLALFAITLGLMLVTMLLDGVERQTAWQILTNMSGGFFNITLGLYASRLNKLR